MINQALSQICWLEEGVSSSTSYSVSGSGNDGRAVPRRHRGLLYTEGGRASDRGCEEKRLSLSPRMRGCTVGHINLLGAKDLEI